MRLLILYLLAATATVALPSPEPDLTPRSPTGPANTLILTQPHNKTSFLADAWPTICYQDSIVHHPVNQFSCAPLITYLANMPDSAVPKLWLPGPVEPEWVLQGCKVTILSGKRKALFSLRDVLVETLKVLTVCQPPDYFGIGGSTPLEGKKGFMYAAFHVQVTGVE